MGKKGQLIFKGDKRPKKKDRIRKKRKYLEGETVVTDVDPKIHESSLPSSSSERIQNNDSVSSETRKAAAVVVGPTIKDGTGKITTSGTVVSGQNTKFEKEISIGDAIIITFTDNNNQKKEEMRVVTMRLSNISLNLSSAFSQNVSLPLNFRYVRKPRNVEQEQRKERQKQNEEAKEKEKSAYDIYGDGNTLVYREKTETGSYRLKQQHISSTSQSTRGDLLHLREKKTSDKYC
jgi:G3E family GTPase